MVNAHRAAGRAGEIYPPGRRSLGSPPIPTLLPKTVSKERELHYCQNHDKADDPHRWEYGDRQRRAKGTAGSSKDVDASQHFTCPLPNSPDDRQDGILDIGQTRRGALVRRLFYPQTISVAST